MLHPFAPSILLLAGALGTPDGLRQGWVPADADLVFHLDVEAVLASEVGKVLMKHMDDFDLDSVEEFGDWTKQLELEPGRDVAALTVYTAPGTGESPVVVVSVSDAALRLFDDLPEEVEHEMRTVDGREVHSFNAEGGRLYAHVGAAAGGRHPVVFCTELDAVSRAAAVIARDAPSLARSDNPLAKRVPQPGTFLFAAARDVKRLTGGGGPTSHLLKESTGFTFAAGEHAGEFFAEATIDARDEEAAGDIADMAQGLLALARLIASNEDTSAEVKRGRRMLLRAIDVSARGSEIQLGFRGPAAALAALLDQD